MEIFGPIFIGSVLGIVVFVPIGVMQVEGNPRATLCQLIGGVSVVVFLGCVCILPFVVLAKQQAEITELRQQIKPQ